MIQWANSNGSPIVSIDVPSGLDASTGKVYGEVINAKSIVTLGLPKTGLSASMREQKSVYLTDIGIPSSVYSQVLEIGDYVSPFGDDKFIVKLL